MSVCSQCGCSLPGDQALCSYHPAMNGDDWATSNRIMCDLFHRGVIPPRLSEAERLADLVPTDPGMF